MTTNYTRQQKETLSYFRQHARNWEEAAKGTIKEEVNIVRQRNNYVLDVIRQRKVTKAMFDVGCGTGDLICDAAKAGIVATGIDFADEMIQIARNKAKESLLESAKFICCSIFDFDIQPNHYDLISANGFIEYISLDELSAFLSAAHRGLTQGGSIVLGSRNRLFNLFSMNEFTISEVRSGAACDLLREAVAINNCGDLNDLATVEPAALSTNDEPQKRTGVEVFIRYQYTPVQLIHILREHGFHAIHLAPVHIHGISPKLKDKYPSLHYSLSNLLQSFAESNMELIPCASSFMIHAQRC